MAGAVTLSATQPQTSFVARDIGTPTKIVIQMSDPPVEGDEAVIWRSINLQNTNSSLSLVRTTLYSHSSARCSVFISGAHRLMSSSTSLWLL